MIRFRFVPIAVLALSTFALPSAQAKPRKSLHRSSGHVLVSRKKVIGHASVHGRRGARGRYVAKAAPASSWRNRQLAPSSDRYREIQEALVSKGYLKSTPTGSWDADSQDALKRFQADQKLEQTGKLNSLSLIALGLGPAKSEPAAAAPAPPAPELKP